MTNTNATNFRKNIFEYLNQAVEYNDVINVTTKNGNAVVLSEADYNSLLETVYLMSHPATATPFWKECRSHWRIVFHWMRWTGNVSNLFHKGCAETIA